MQRKAGIVIEWRIQTRTPWRGVQFPLQRVVRLPPPGKGGVNSTFRQTSVSPPPQIIEPLVLVAWNWSSRATGSLKDQEREITKDKWMIIGCHLSTPAHWGRGPQKSEQKKKVRKNIHLIWADDQKRQRLWRWWRSAPGHKVVRRAHLWGRHIEPGKGAPKPVHQRCQLNQNSEQGFWWWLFGQTDQDYAELPVQRWSACLCPTQASFPAGQSLKESVF